MSRRSFRAIDGNRIFRATFSKHFFKKNFFRRDDYLDYRLHLHVLFRRNESSIVTVRVYSRIVHVRGGTRKPHGYETTGHASFQRTEIGFRIRNDEKRCVAANVSSFCAFVKVVRRTLAFPTDILAARTRFTRANRCVPLRRVRHTARRTRRKRLHRRQRGGESTRPVVSVAPFLTVLSPLNSIVVSLDIHS